MMLRLRFLVPVLGLSIVAAACTTDDGVGTGDDGGAGGESPGPVGGEGGGGGEGGSGGACVEGGTGKLVIEVSGLPADVAPALLVDGPDALSVEEAEVSFEDVATGDYTVTAARVFDADPIVRTVYEATVTAPSFCLGDGGEHTIQVTYAAIPSSNKLWMPTDRDDELAAFDSFAIAESGLTDAGVAIDGPGSKGIAFDRDGNLWAFGPTVADAHIARFPAAGLGESGTREPDIEINLNDVSCVPAMRSLAFDADGNLWLSVCGGEIHRIPAADLTTSGDKDSDILVAGADESAEGLAFDADGNLWVANGTTLARYDAATIEESTADADATLTPLDGIGGFTTSFLAFDKAGNLWGSDFGANTLYQVAAADLAAVGVADVDVGVTITIGVEALLNQMAFDDGGGLWLGLGQDADGVGAFGRLSPTQLGVSTPNGEAAQPSIVIESASIGAGLPVAFFPAPEGLPLYHSIPTP